MTASAGASVLGSEAVPVSARRAQTRERLMAAATTVFAERGVIGASVEEICEAAGFTRGAFYSNFVDKDALVLALIEAGVQAQYTAAEQALAGLSEASHDLAPEALVAQALSRFDALGRPSREGVLVQQELLLHAARVPALREPYAAFAEACAARLSGVISHALAAAGLEFVLPFDAALDLLIAAHAHTQVQSLFPGPDGPNTRYTMVLAITRSTRQPATPTTGSGARQELGRH